MTTAAAKMRPMNESDVPAVARLFLDIFRPHLTLTPCGFEDYLRDLLFSHPLFGHDEGSLLSLKPNGDVQAVLLAVPMRFRLGEEIVAVRMPCSFMQAKDANPAATGALVLATLRKRRFCLSDTAAPVSLRHWRAVGGISLPWQSLEWCRIFRPTTFGIGLVLPRLGRFARPALALTGLIDRGLTRLRRHNPGPNPAKVAAIEADEFAAAMEAALRDLTIAPAFTGADLEWIRRLSAAPGSSRIIQYLGVFNDAGERIGVFSFRGVPGLGAEVLDVFSDRDQQDAVLDALFHHLKTMGYGWAQGQLRQDLVEPLSRQRQIWMRHRAHVCVCSSDPALREAARANRLHVGGLAGETWSRLMHDFF